MEFPLKDMSLSSHSEETMMTKIAILGASGHGKVVAEVAELNGYENIVFFDDRFPVLNQLEHWNVVGTTEDLLKDVSKFDAVVVAIGNNEVRLIKQNHLVAMGATLVTLIHPSAVISRYAKIGIGTVVMANSVVNAFSYIGDANIINTGATVDHDCILANGVHVSPGVNLAGGVQVGEGSWLGIGCKVKQLIAVGRGVVVGAGSVVVSDITDFETVVGNPAKPLL